MRGKKRRRPQTLTPFIDPMIRLLIVGVAIVPCVILLLPAVALIALVSAFTSTVRAVARRFEPAHMPWSELIEFDRQLGWRPLPNLDCHYLALDDDVFHIVTDREGWPGATSLDENKVIVVGDSFAFGYGIDTHRSFAALTPDLSVKAVGAPGYSMVHGVRLMEQFGERLREKLVVWFAFLENDLQDNLAPEMRGYRAPFLRLDRTLGTWEIVDQHIRAGKWDCSELDSRRLFSSFCVPGPRADRAFAACDVLIQRARLACDRVGAGLVIVTIPHPIQLTSKGREELATLSGMPQACDPDLPDRRIAESCRRHAVPFIIGRQHFARTDYKQREGIHWNQRGHRRMASLLKELYELFLSGRLAELCDDSVRPEATVVTRSTSTLTVRSQSPTADGVGTSR